MRQGESLPEKLAGTPIREQSRPPGDKGPTGRTADRASMGKEKGRDRVVDVSRGQHAWLASAQAGDQLARQQVIEANLRLVHSIVHRFRNRGADYDDLFQIGCIGLMKAIDGFDLERGVRFSTYAVPVIIGEIRRYFRDDHTLKVSRSLRELARTIEAARDELSQQLGRAPAADEIAHHLDISPEEVAAAWEAIRPPESLDELTTNDEGSSFTLHQQMASEEHTYSRLVDSLALQQALSGLGEWERQLVLLRYIAQRSQADTARELGVSQAHVSRYERRILTRLRRTLS